MRNYERFTGMVEAGEVELIHIEAVPRSVSTALARALSESDMPSICVNEPFNRMRHDAEEGAGRLLEAVDSAPRPDDKPLLVVSKNTARNISSSLFSELTSMSTGVVWSIRDPHVQLSALVTRIVNDVEFEPGADQLAMKDLTDAHLQTAVDFLQSGPTSVNFSKTSWTAIGEHYRNLGRVPNAAVVDGGIFTTRPEFVLQGACARLGLPFSSQMVDGWRGTLFNANDGYNATMSDSTHAWTKDAVVNSGVVLAPTKTIPVERMPEPLRQHLAEVALPVYESMSTYALGNE